MTINVSLNNLTSLQNENTAVTQINQNSSLIEGGFTTALNTTGDQMEGTLDMNSNNIINLPVPATANSPLRLQDLNTFIGGGTIASIPSGGSTGDVLVKESGANFNVGWAANANISAGTGISISGSNPVTVGLSATAGSNITISGSTAVTINTVTSPNFTTVTTKNVSNGSSNLGFGLETNPQASVVFSQNAVSGISVPAQSTAIWSIGVTGTPAGFNTLAFGNQAQYQLARVNGNPTAPTAIVSGNLLGSLAFRGYNGSSSIPSILVEGVASENWTGTANGSYFTFLTTASGSNTAIQAERIMAGVIVGSATTDPGSGNLSVSGTISSGGPNILPQYTVTTLPSTVTGARVIVTDATATSFGSTVTGGSTNVVPVFYTGSAWRIG